MKKAAVQQWCEGWHTEVSIAIYEQSSFLSQKNCRWPFNKSSLKGLTELCVRAQVYLSVLFSSRALHVHPNQPVNSSMQERAHLEAGKVFLPAKSQIPAFLGCCGISKADLCCLARADLCHVCHGIGREAEVSAAAGFLSIFHIIGFLHKEQHLHIKWVQLTESGFHQIQSEGNFDEVVNCTQR